MTLINPQALRRAFGSFMTGVTVVTTRDAAGQPVGFTANSFSSVSIDPPLLLVCPGKFLSSYDSFANCAHFAISVLAEGQEDVSNTFASFKGDRFAAVPHVMDDHNIPVIDGALAQFSCKTHQVVPAGDHCILIGEVTDYAHHHGHALGYAGGRYFSLGLEQEAATPRQETTICGAVTELLDKILLEKTPDGYRPLQVVVPKGGTPRGALATDLARRGIAATLGSVYSAFHDVGSAAQSTYTYFLASSTQASPAEDVEWVPIEALNRLTYTTPAIATMMARYALEAETRRFSLYIGDAQSGDVHPLPDRS